MRGQGERDPLSSPETREDCKTRAKRGTARKREDLAETC